MKRSSLYGFVLLAGAGCAHSRTETDLSELREHLTETQRKEAEGRRKIEELENRLFLITDQLESQRVTSVPARAPRLPVVTLRPSEEERDRGAETRAEAGRPGDEDIEFTGAAKSADNSRVRPVLRGDGMIGAASTSGLEHAPEHASRRKAHSLGNTGDASRDSDVRLASQSDDQLGVAPVPSIPQILKSSPAAKAMPPSVAQGEHPVDQDALTQYRLAYAEVTTAHYDDAVLQLRAFVARYPRHDYADNARYWIGECFYARQRYREAAVEFRATVAQYPFGNKAPDALLKLSFSLLGLGEAAEARRMLDELPQTYPRSEAARLATQKIVELSASAKKTVEAPR